MNQDKLVPTKMKSQLPEIKQYSHQELLEMANLYHDSGLAPKHLKTVAAIYIAYRWALALQLDPFLGLNDIFVIDNKPSLRTEAAMAVVRTSGFCEYIEQSFEGNKFDDNFTAICKVKRKGENEHISTFSVADAKKAGLWDKKTYNGEPTSWIKYPPRMLMYRAVGFALRDVFPEALRGAKLFEEIIDYSDYEVIEDKSTDKEINVVVEKSYTKKSGLGRLMSDMNEAPPED